MGDSGKDEKIYREYLRQKEEWEDRTNY